MPGTITMKAAEGKTVTTTARSDGKFTARVPVGTYTVTGRTPRFIVNGSEGTCVSVSSHGPISVVVAAGQAVSVTVVCPTK